MASVCMVQSVAWHCNGELGVLRMRPIRLVSQLGKHNGKRADACPDDMDSRMDIR